MWIGIDFDNTIVSYDALFHKVARERDLIPAHTPVNKVAVRDHLRRSGLEDGWTEMQGYVYGARMDEASAYPGAIDFIRDAIVAGHAVTIISHKTRHPFLGPQYDLHAAARQWIERHLRAGGRPLLAESQVFFELTKEKKLARIAASACDVYIDDLPEILEAPGFPASTRALLFDPEGNHCMPGTATFARWPEIAGHLGVR